MLATLTLAASLLLPNLQEPVLLQSTPTLTEAGRACSLNIYSDGTVTLVDLQNGEKTSATGVRWDVRDTPPRWDGRGVLLPWTNGDDASGGGNDRQVLRTRWRDATGTEHEVVTPVSGRSDASRRASLDRHLHLVRIYQNAVPPAPPPTTGSGSGSGMALLGLRPLRLAA